MRLWSLHPKYLDPAGLVALWREALLAQAVLAGKTRGYTAHPQLNRFRETNAPRGAIATYLHEIAFEAARRGYGFDRTKIGRRATVSLTVTTGQLRYEWAHLKSKLRRRNPEAYRAIARIRVPDAHPSFVVIEGPIAEWERR